MPLIVRTLSPAWKAYQLEKKSNALVDKLSQYGENELGSYLAATGFKKQNETLMLTARCVICEHAKSYGLTMFAAPIEMDCAKKDTSCSKGNPTGECELFKPISTLRALPD